MQLPAVRGKQRSEPCDIILTDRRFVLGVSENRSSLPLDRIETCMITETGGRIRNRPLLILGTKEEMHTIRFPSGSARSRAMLDAVAAFTLSMALK